MRMTYLLATGLILTAGFAAPAFAGTAKPTQVKTTISTEDLSTQAGIEKVYEELQDTAKANCKVTGRKSLANRAFEQVCEARLMNEFIEDVNHQGLTAYHKVMKTA